MARPRAEDWSRIFHTWRMGPGRERTFQENHLICPRTQQGVGLGLPGPWANPPSTHSRTPACVLGWTWKLHPCSPSREHTR